MSFPSESLGQHFAPKMKPPDGSVFPSIDQLNQVFFLAGFVSGRVILFSRTLDKEPLKLSTKTCWILKMNLPPMICLYCFFHVFEDATKTSPCQIDFSCC